MKQRHADLSIADICHFLGKTQQTYYYHLRYRSRVNEINAFVISRVIAIRADLPGVGVPKLLHILRQEAAFQVRCLGRDKLYDLLRSHNLLLARGVRSGCKTTDSRNWYRRFPNLIRDLIVSRPNQLWVSDITYLSTYTGFCYLSLVTDAYSHRIVGYCVHHDLKTHGPATALKMALMTLDPATVLELIHHSDRGRQYGSAIYLQIAAAHPNLKMSMTEKGDPYENPIAERVNGILKTEFKLGKIFANVTEIKSAVQIAIKNYNEKRPHGSCDYLTPDQAHQNEGILKKRWKNTYQIKKQQLEQQSN